MRLWGGRFEGGPGEAMRRLNDSFGFDRRLYAQDIRGSVAYAGALREAGVITAAEHDAIIAGLAEVLAEFEADRFEPLPTDEDIHTAVERRLAELIGPAAGKLHTGRSRNDQVALDFRLWLLDAIAALRADIAAVQRALVEQAAAHPDLLLPGMTHLQPAQPVPYAHWLLSHFWPLERDRARLADCARRTAVSPLGAGALAGNPLAIDRAALADALGLPAATENSLDAVSDRDFAAEYLFGAALVGVHLSRLGEDVILYSSPAFGFVRVGEGYATGSSLMPQKRNPDAFELARGKAGRLLGNLTGLLTTLKGLPAGYNKDLQEDKEAVFDASDTLALLLPVMAGAVAALQPNPTAMQAALDPAMLATDLADYLVARGVPFREAHGIVGGVVRRAEEAGVPLDALPLAEFQAESPHFEADVRGVFDFARSAASRAVTGGTAPAAIQAQIKAARAALDAG